MPRPKSFGEKKFAQKKPLYLRVLCRKPVCSTHRNLSKATDLSPLDRYEVGHKGIQCQSSKEKTCKKRTSLHPLGEKETS